ncbi:spore germination protein [Desulforamulus reducens MI-1]|uniref:Spore germination protein n=1 Tax=Desulforamulus reducens (strain ATCC BAA-1160 / DSM 100696 / MI-1) TaxID=349161 RepID=A4J5A5_DESRM|nr:endospore germination permease [Desulforamulus reducens]ABO50258.1 spore germination protein [Desulforamulus reducens MI-1]
MIQEGKIGFAEGFSLLLITNISILFLTLPAKLIGEHKTMAYLVYFLVLVMVLLIFWLMAALMKRHQNITLIEVSEKLLGPYLGMVINLVFVLYFIVWESLLLRMYSETFITTALPRTPVSAVLTTLVLAAFISAFYGLEVLARVARVSLTFIVLGLTIVFLSIMKEVDVTNLYPLWTSEPITLFSNGVLHYTAAADLLVPAIIIHAFGGWRHFCRAGLLAFLTSRIIVGIALLLILLTFGVQPSSEMLLPFYELSKLISFGRFFQRLEAVFLLTWSMVGYIKIGLYLYIIAVILARMFRLEDYRPLLWVVALLCYVLSILPADLPTALVYYEAMRGTLGLVPTLAVPLLLLLVSMFKKNEELGNDDSKT